MFRTIHSELSKAPIGCDLVHLRNGEEHGDSPQQGRDGPLNRSPVAGDFPGRV
jgi:hypothetical protein